MPAPTITTSKCPVCCNAGSASAAVSVIRIVSICAGVWRMGSFVEPEYGALVAARKACRVCVERSPGKIRSCAEFDFDPDVVSHWEAWLGHKRPKLLALGQDFGHFG